MNRFSFSAFLALTIFLFFTFVLQTLKAFHIRNLAKTPIWKRCHSNVIMFVGTSNNHIPIQHGKQSCKNYIEQRTNLDQFCKVVIFLSPPFKWNEFCFIIGSHTRSPLRADRHMVRLINILMGHHSV